MKRKEIITFVHSRLLQLVYKLWFQKNVEKKTILMKPKHHCHLSQLGECVYGAQSRIKKRLLCVSMFVQFDGWALIIKKMVERKAFLLKPNHWYLVSQCQERFCDAQS